MSFEIRVPKHSLLGTLDEYIDLYEQTESGLILKHISLFAIDELNKSGNPYTEKDVCDKIDGYILDRTLTKLAQNGCIDVEFDENGQPTYQVTEQGRELAKQIKERLE